MKPNVGGVDRAIRIVLGIGLIAWGIYASNWLGILGVPLLLSGILGQCGLYRLFGISTCRVR